MRFNANFKSIQVRKSPIPTTPKTSNVLKFKYENTTVPKGINIKAKNDAGYSFNGWYVEQSCQTQIFFDEDLYNSATGSKILCKTNVTT